MLDFIEISGHETGKSFKKKKKRKGDVKRDRDVGVTLFHCPEMCLEILY